MRYPPTSPPAPYPRTQTHLRSSNSIKFSVAQSPPRDGLEPSLLPCYLWSLILVMPEHKGQSS